MTIEYRKIKKISENMIYEKVLAPLVAQEEETEDTDEEEKEEKEEGSETDEEKGADDEM